MEGSTHAIVLHTTKYGETSIMLHCYTEQAGLRSYVVKGARSKKKNKTLSMGMFQPLTQLELLASTPKSTRLPILKAAKIIHPYATISTDVVKSSICLFLAEFLSKILKIDLKNEPLFEFIKQSLLWFDNSSKASNFHLLFILKLSDYLGIMPKYSSNESLYFDIENGIFTNTPMSNNYIKDRVVKDLKDILGIKFDYNNEILTKINQRKDMLNFLISYYEYHVPGFKRPKSVDILNEVFS